MATIYANTTDGYQASGLKGSWNDAHDATSTQTLNTSATSGLSAWGPRSEYAAARSAYYLVRTFFDWDVSSISGTISEAKIYVKTANAPTGGPKNIIIKSGHDPSDTSTHWYSTMITGLGITYSGWNNSTSGVLALSAAVTAAGANTYTGYDLNSDGISLLQSVAGSSSTFKVALLNYDHDYLDVAPTGTQMNGIYYANYSGTSSDPYLEYEVATGYTHGVMGVAGASISTVKGVATANIDEVMGV